MFRQPLAEWSRAALSEGVAQLSFRFPLLIRLSGVLLAFCALAATSCSSTSNGTPESSSASETTSSLLPAAEGKTEYPLTLTSPYGESVIDKRPTRVATVGANAVDTELLLSLGGVPVTTNGLGFNKAPWLKEAAADRIELVFETESWDQYPYESIAAAKPDVIVVFGYDLTNSFAKLSEIAPVVTSDKPWTGYFSNPWQDNIRILGKALDLSGAAEMLAYGGQAARELSGGLAALRNGAQSGTVGGWLEGGAAAIASATDSLNNGARGAQSLTAWLAGRKDGTK